MKEATPQVTVFIGSSSESRSIVEKLYIRLQEIAEVHPWDADIFKPGDVGFAALLTEVDRVDFAVFVISGDDLTITRDQQKRSPRDNVVFELGMFMSKLGPHRTFILYDRNGDPKLPSDLTGITVLQFTHSANLMAALTGAASVIKDRMRALGPRPDRPKPPPIAYLCGPHNNLHSTARALERNGITVNVPAEFLRGSARKLAENRRLCCDMIAQSDALIVDLDSYGLDSAWEMGYAEALGIPVVGLYLREDVVGNPREVNKRQFLENFMHGWDSSYFYSRSLDEVIERCGNKLVYVFCPFKNDAAAAKIGQSNLAKRARGGIFNSRELLGLHPDNPRSYTWQARQQTVRLIEEVETILTVLPRYGMDTAWKLGYASAIGKEIVGWVTDDFGSKVTQADLLDHWMHGWRSKPRFTNLDDLATFMIGLQARTTTRDRRAHIADPAR